MSLLGSILWTKKRKWQLLVAGVGLVLGLLLILLSIQVHFHVSHAMGEESHEGKWEYLVVTEEVAPINTLSVVSEAFSSGFSESEINDLKAQPFTKDLSSISVNNFSVVSNLADVFDFYADLFFEAVPDHMLDTLPEGWGWQEGDGLLPVLMNKEWFNMYNFNVSVMYGLPQFTTQTLMGLQFKIWIGDERKSFDAKIVGFSYRMPAITIPQSFMDWANKKYGQGTTKPTKLMLAVEDASNPAIKNYLDEHSLDANTEQLLRDSFKALAQTIYAVTAFTGLLFTLLSLVIFVTTMQLVVSRAKDEIRLLIELGYRPASLAATLIRQFSVMVIISTLAAFVFMLIANGKITKIFAESGFIFSGNIAMLTIIVAVLVPVGMLLINYAAVKSGIKKLYS